MNTPEVDNPMLTAYALGELSPADAARVRQWIASSQEARAEYVRIEHAITALKKGAAIPKRTLHPHQRETILAMAPAAPRRANVIPFTPSTARVSKSSASSFAW